MKNVLITLTLIFAGFSFAAEPPLITKNSGGGHMMPEYAGTETCEVFSDRVQITHRLGFYTPTALTVSESRSVRVTGNVVAVIAEAAKETLEEKPNTLCDGPSTTIMAGDVVLF
ncbi:MAG: hypothetical protein HY537_01605, partial [Deltaproteobacteria bacterium]|nr:hypothetical protein [Deltaproteobacteria bacterium]